LASFAIKAGLAGARNFFRTHPFFDMVKAQQSVSSFLIRRNTVFPAAIFATPKTQREKAASSPRASRPVSKDEADPWQIHHPYCFTCCN
jgi:hypothetical protein